jgi:hypothetical protein
MARHEHQNFEPGPVVAASQPVAEKSDRTRTATFSLDCPGAALEGYFRAGTAPGSPRLAMRCPPSPSVELP